MEIKDGSIVSYYCNVAMPSILTGNEIRFVDLDLDLVKKYNEKWKVIDEDDFVDNSHKYNYPPELKKYALHSLERLKEKAKIKEFPFNDKALGLYHSFIEKKGLNQ